ncbi:hypothetical protein EYF80_004994 [Liparis tanakae]|uniref:Uncharacterized protein n=1 Tax=Liparis tanakae TaxID=230148 RepID=A0A4Z2J3Z9_9TELE|nr:hypothetical protein EYF80_004994 [Liparis tanakae]
MAPDGSAAHNAAAGRTPGWMDVLNGLDESFIHSGVVEFRVEVKGQTHTQREVLQLHHLARLASPPQTSHIFIYYAL